MEVGKLAFSLARVLATVEEVEDPDFILNYPIDDFDMTDNDSSDSDRKAGFDLSFRRPVCQSIDSIQHFGE